MAVMKILRILIINNSLSITGNEGTMEENLKEFFSATEIEGYPCQRCSLKHILEDLKEPLIGKDLSLSQGLSIRFKSECLY